MLKDFGAITIADMNLLIDQLQQAPPQQLENKLIDEGVTLTEQDALGLFKTFCERNVLDRYIKNKKIKINSFNL